MQDTRHVLLDTIERSRHRESRDRHTAGVRLDHGETEGIREAREHQHIRRRQAVHELLAEAVPGEHRARVAGLERLPLGPIADHHLGAGQVQAEKRLEILLDGEPPDAGHYRPRQPGELRVRRQRPEGAQVDSALPAVQVLEAAPAQLRLEGGAADEGAGRGPVEAPEPRVARRERDGVARAHVLRIARVV